MNIHMTVADIVAERPARSRVFEQLGINYCCGGNKPLEQACAERGIDAESVVQAIQEAEREEAEATPSSELASLPTSEVVEHIRSTHHHYVHNELPRLHELVAKVSHGHAEDDPRLPQVREVFEQLAELLTSHVERAEQGLFAGLEKETAAVGASAGDVSADTAPVKPVEESVQELARDHEAAQAHFETLVDLTDGYNPPEWACNSVRAMLDGLYDLHKETKAHFDTEQGVLFERVSPVR